MYYILNKHPLEMTLADRWTESLVRYCGGGGDGGDGGHGMTGGGWSASPHGNPAGVGLPGTGPSSSVGVSALSVSPTASHLATNLGFPGLGQSMSTEGMIGKGALALGGMMMGDPGSAIMGIATKGATGVPGGYSPGDFGPGDAPGGPADMHATPRVTSIDRQYEQVKEKIKGATDADKLVAQYGGTIDSYLETQEGLLKDLLSTGLTPEEVASFEAQYQAELDALTAEYDRMTERQGASRLSELVGRGVLDTTTGERIMAEDQEEWTRMFTGAQSQLETTKLGAMEDFESAKKGMNLAKYQLQSDMTQKQIDLALAASMSQQNYLMGKGGIKANEALNQALIQQQQSKLDYDKRSQLWGTVSGVGMDLLKSGLSGLF